MSALVRAARIGLIAAALAAASAHAYFGTIDYGFGFEGRAFTNFGGASQTDVALAVALQPDGRIVSAGYVDGSIVPPGGPPPQSPLAIARHNAAGALDPTFGGSGKLTDGVQYGTFLGSTASAHGVAVQSDGGIVVAGTWFAPGFNTGSTGTRNLVVARYSATGAANGQALTSLDGHSAANAVRTQPDGKILAAGYSYVHPHAFVAAGPRRFALARYNADLTLDASFNGTGKVVTSLGSGDAQCNAIALQADGRIIAVGSARNGPPGDFAVARYSPAGILESAAIVDAGSSEDLAMAAALQSDGKVLVGGSSGTSTSALVRLTASNVLDETFANGGRFLFAGRPISSVVLQPDGKILALTQDFHVWRLDAAGVPDATFGVGGRVVLRMPPSSTAYAMALQPDGRIVIAGHGNGGSGQDFLLTRIDPSSIMPDPNPSAAAIDFGAQSMNTTSAPVTLNLSTGGGTITVTRLATTPGFAIASHNCATMQPLSVCSIDITFTPGASGPHDGTLQVESTGSTFAVSLRGTGERSLVKHYYQSILRRTPDSAGRAFWDGEAARVAGLGASVNEVWFAMAQQFYFSAEYAAFNRTNTDFVTDLYNTFFNRAPDSGGLGFWVGRLGQGMPREVALAEFMFSAEFRNFTQAIFGNASARAEVNTVMDFYRGLLARTPDDQGFGFWVSRFRSAQCQGAGTVVIVVEEISGAFTLSSEYAGRSRTNAQYVGDLYNAFLRRGGDLQGVQYWIAQLDSGARTREQMRVEFKNSAEFQGRVNAIIQQGCMT